jgi:hypothetical protein
MRLRIEEVMGSVQLVTRAGRFASRIAALAFAERHYGCFRFVFSVIDRYAMINSFLSSDFHFLMRLWGRGEHAL